MSSNLQAFSTFQANPKQPILAPRLSDSQTKKKSFFRSLFPGFRVKSLTFFISILHCLIFAASEIYAYKLNSNDQSDIFQCILYKFGALYTPSVLKSYQVFRLIMSSLLHAKIYQVIVTTISLWMTAFKLESVYGTSKFFIFYLLTNISGNLFSAVIEPNTMIVGPSGVAGLLALSLAYLIENWERIEKTQRIRTVIFDIVLIAINVALAVIMANNTLSSFLGGFMVGVSMAVLVIRTEPRRAFNKKEWAGLFFTIIFFIATSICLATAVIPTDSDNSLSNDCANTLGWSLSFSSIF